MVEWDCSNFMELTLFITLFILGLILGSYLNSWIWRVYNHKWRFGGRSECVHCSRQLTWWENIPLVSFVFLRGKCKTCKKPIPSDYFLVELCTGILFVIVAFIHSQSFNLTIFQSSLVLFRDLFFTALLIVIFVYDYKYQYILSGVVWAGAIIALAFNYSQLLLAPYSLLLGMAIGGGLFLAQYLISKGRWIGGGDVRLGVMMGALLGWPNILFALFISYILGALVSIPLLIFKKKGLNSQIPFGTFLAVGTFITLFWGGQIVGWYLNLLKL